MITEPLKIYLETDWKDCPDCWKNFFHYQFSHGKRHYSASTEEVDNKLEPWNAAIVEDSKRLAIKFNTDEDKLLFLLRWS